MAAPLIELYLTDDATPAPTVALGEVIEGAVAAGTTYNVWNHIGSPGNDTARDCFVTCLERPKPTGGDPNPAWHQEGQLTQEGWLEVRVTGVATDGLEAQTTDWRPVGEWKRASVFDIPADSFRQIEWRLAVPNGIATEDYEFRIAVGHGGDILAVSEGFQVSRLVGVAPEVGDDDAASLLYGYDAAEASSPDNTVEFSDGAAIIGGVPYVDLAHAVTFSNLDGSAAALASGEEYLATVSKGAAAGLTVTKSDKGASPLPTSDRPALPAGERLVTYVVVPFDATINTAEIDQALRQFGRLAAEYDSGSLIVTIHPGASLAADRRLRRTGTRSVTLSATSTEVVWVAPNGSLEAVAEGSPATVSNSLPIWKFTTDGSGVTAAVDLRTYVDAHDASLLFEIRGTLSAGLKARAVYRGRATGYLSLPEPVVMYLADSGTGTGSTKLEIRAGGTTLFTSSGTDDRRPAVAAAASPAEDRASLPEKLDLSPGELLEVEVVSVPTGADSADLTLLLRVHGG